MAMHFQEAVEEIVRADGRYTREAYHFLREALDTSVKRRKKSRKDNGVHVSAAELLDGFRLHALQEFGPMAITVLEYWGVRTCEDVGNMVWSLVETGAFGRTEEDTLEEFRAGYDFEDAFVRPFRVEQGLLSKSGTRAVESP
jgi:uncharacterized repeat protein (TIGR04138 family)